MMRKLLTLVILITLVIYTVAEEISEKSDEKTEIAPRRRKHFYSALFPLVGLGGLHAISAFVAIKLKLVVVFILIAATAFFGFKIWTGSALFGCKNRGPEEYIHEGPIIPYDSGHIVSHSGPGSGISYSNPEPYSAWNPDAISSGPPSGGGDFHHDFHHDFHNDFHHDHHDFQDFHHDSHPITSHDHHDHSDTTGTTATAGGSPSGPEMSSKRRVAYQSPGARQNSFDWTSLAFAVLGVDTMVCRKRFVCEMEVQSKGNPFFGFAYNYLSRGMLQEYREFPEIPENLADCARLFKECYSPADDQHQKDPQDPNEEPEEATEEESSTDSAESVGRQIVRRMKRSE